MGSSPFLTPDKLKKEEKYNHFFMVNEETYYKQNASRYLVRMIDEESDQDLNVVLNWFHPDFYKSTFEKIGFVNFRWVEMSLHGDLDNAEYWRDFVTDCSLIMYEAFKPSE